MRTNEGISETIKKLRPGRSIQEQSLANSTPMTQAIEVTATLSPAHIILSYMRNSTVNRYNDRIHHCSHTTPSLNNQIPAMIAP